MIPMLILILVLCIVFLVPLFERGFLYGFFGILLVTCGVIIVENREYRNRAFENFSENTNFFDFCVMGEPHEYHNVKFICEEMK